MKYENIVSDIKKGNFAPIYTLCGEEAYYIDQIEALLLENAISEEQKDFNLSIHYGEDADVGQIIDNAKRYPMMSERQLVVVRECQLLDEFKNLEQYASAPLDTTILILLYKHGKPNGKLKVTKALKKKPNIFFESKSLYDNQVPRWIRNYLQSKGYKIEGKETQILSEYLGTDLGKVANELDKLTINLSEGETITGKIIEQNIGISPDYSLFVLQEAITAKDSEKVFRILQYYSSDIKKHSPIMVIAILTSFFFKMITLKSLEGKPTAQLKKASGTYSDYLLKKNIGYTRKYSMNELLMIIQILYELDLRAKGVGDRTTTDEEILFELGFRLMAPGRVNYDSIFTEV